MSACLNNYGYVASGVFEGLSVLSANLVCYRDPSDSLDSGYQGTMFRAPLGVSKRFKVVK